jgi:predicted Co/Zn/Cd cation transporter (cation efflux family)
MEISVLSMISSAVLVLVCMYLIISPFFKNELNLFEPVIDLTTHDHKAALMTTLNEIEFEHKMHKVSDEDYKKLKKQYEVLLSDLIKDNQQMDQKEVDHDLLKEIEEEIENELRRRKEEQGRK